MGDIYKVLRSALRKNQLQQRKADVVKPDV